MVIAKKIDKNTLAMKKALLLILIAIVPFFCGYGQNQIEEIVEERTKEIFILDGTVVMEISEGFDFPCIGIRLSDKTLNWGLGTYIEIKKRGDIYLMRQWDGKEYTTMQDGIEDELKDIILGFYEDKDQEERGLEVWKDFVYEGGLQSFMDFVNEVVDDEFLNSSFNETYG